MVSTWAPRGALVLSLLQFALKGAALSRGQSAAAAVERVLPTIAPTDSAPPPAPPLSAEAWMGVPGRHGWPELKLPAIAGRPAAGIAFSGGGSRSYTLSLAYLAVLRELGLLDKLRYMTGISGGSWAVSVYAYARHEYCCNSCALHCSNIRAGAPLNISQLLGATPEPSTLTWPQLRRMDPGSATTAGTIDLVTTIAANALEVNGDDIWYKTVQDMYLGPVGIPDRQPFTWSQDTAREIALRNTGLNAESFVTVRGSDQAPFPWPTGMPPFPIVGTTLLGPKALAPFPSNNKSYTLLEVTPLYVGMPVHHNITYYHWHLLRKDQSVNRTVGGYIEPFAFGGRPPRKGLPPQTLTGLLDTPAPSRNFSIAMAAGDSSYAPGGVLSQDFLPISEWLNVLGATLPYWSPADPTPGNGDGLDAPPNKKGKYEDAVYADGGIVENLAMIGLVRRGVRTILACFSSDQPLATNKTWDPRTQAPTAKVIDADIPSYFGVNIAQLGQDEHRDQIFAKSDFVRVAMQMQASQAEGHGIVTTTALKTVENLWWGIPAGLELNVTWIVLGRVLQWEAELPADIAKQVVPEGKAAASDPHKLPIFGAFRNFPNLNTGTQQTLSHAQANLLSSLGGWIIRKNNATLTRAFSYATY